MKITHEDRSALIKRLPNLKLSYENIHKKVFSDLYVIIPKGKKHLVWFTYFEDKKVCIFIEVIPGTLKYIRDMFIVPQMFEKKIVIGSIFFGTLFSIGSRKYFSIENIHLYKGKNVENINDKNKLQLINNILNTEIKSSIITQNGIALGLPIIHNDFQEAINICKNLPYNVYSIQNRNYNSHSSTYNSTVYKEVELDTSHIVFAIKPDIQADVYFLHYTNNIGNLEKYDMAAIPDFKTSKMMNSIFRNIKENDNLDALEESDDDEDFENINDDKYVTLDKCVHMECIFNKRLNKYIPIKLNDKSKVVSKNEISKKY
jgi:hypothetical protein